ncbi:MAG TPA: cohesin domain-containing protein [Patescibacteria group bacterium]|nr:cohesin domain-containing protein [Patescibacteria group bacterium]
MKLSPRVKLLLGGLLFLALALPVTISLTQQQQDPRSRAAESTTLSLIPQPGDDSSIEKTVGESVPVDVIVDPGSNAVATVRMQVKYDPTKLEPVAPYYTPYSPPVANAQRITEIIEFPPPNNGLVSIAVTSGTDTTKAVTNTAKIGTFLFKAIGTTPENMPTKIEFTNATQAYSVGSNDQSAEDILSNTNFAEISISAAEGPTITQVQGETALSFSILLHGVGMAGDTPNPTNSSLSNKQPKHPQRNLLVEIFNANDELITSKTGCIVYISEDDEEPVFNEEVCILPPLAEINAHQGKFIGIIPFPELQTGSYTIKITSDRYLRKAFPGIISIVSGQTKAMPTIELVSGDTNNDNVLTILDYNAFLDCGYGELTVLPITNSNAAYNKPPCKTHEPRINIDLDDNGYVNAFDYNLFLRELSVQGGD